MRMKGMDYQGVLCKSMEEQTADAFFCSRFFGAAFNYSFSLPLTSMPPCIAFLRFLASCGAQGVSRLAKAMTSYSQIPEAIHLQPQIPDKPWTNWRELVYMTFK